MTGHFYSRIKTFPFGYQLLISNSADIYQAIFIFWRYLYKPLKLNPKLLCAAKLLCREVNKPTISFNIKIIVTFWKYRVFMPLCWFQNKESLFPTQHYLCGAYNLGYVFTARFDLTKYWSSYFLIYRVKKMHFILKLRLYISLCYHGLLELWSKENEK
jgi:hypothetical protein